MCHPDTPILVGTGEYSERIDAPDFGAFSPIQLAAKAGILALDDALTAKKLGPHVDMLAAVRTFEDSAPRFAGPFGKSNNFPRSIAGHMNITPENVIWDIVGGQSPQILAAEMCEMIATKKIAMGLVAGGEAMSTARYFAARNASLDWSETVSGTVEDRGLGSEEMLSATMVVHGIAGTPPAYALFENARRRRLGLAIDTYRMEMARLFAPFTQVASQNPHAMSRAVYSAADLITVSEKNRMIADPYPRRLVARDQVNQSAALLFTSVGLAEKLHIAPEKWIFLHGYAGLSEKTPLERQDMGASPAAVLAAKNALAAAGKTMADMACMDLYSCFPIAVFNICDGLGIAPDDARGLTITGGLPFFGGAGNNYSMHAIVQLANKLRQNPGTYGFVGANGGFLSKYAAGVYASVPKNFIPCDSRPAQAELDSRLPVEIIDQADSDAVIETYTVVFYKGLPKTAIVVGRQAATNKRFMAIQAEDDTATLAQIMNMDPLDAKIHVTRTSAGNRFTF